MKMLNGTRVVCSSSSSGMDPYKTPTIRPNSSEYEVKQDFQTIKSTIQMFVEEATMGVQFQTINEAYDIVLKQIKNQIEAIEEFQPVDVHDDRFNGMNDPDCDTWEEWMGWEGAGTRDYSSHVNPYA